MNKLKKVLLIPTIASACAGSLLLFATAFASVQRQHQQQQFDLQNNTLAVNLENNTNELDLDSNGYKKLPSNIFQGPRTSDYIVSLNNGNIAYINENKNVTIIDQKGNLVNKSNYSFNSNAVPLQIVFNDVANEIWYMYGEHSTGDSNFSLKLRIFNSDGSDKTGYIWLLTDINDGHFTFQNALNWHIKQVYGSNNLFIYQKYSNRIYLYNVAKNNENKDTVYKRGIKTFNQNNNSDNNILNIIGFQSAINKNQTYFAVLKGPVNAISFGNYEFYNFNGSFLGQTTIDSNNELNKLTPFLNKDSFPQNMGFSYERIDNSISRFTFSQVVVASSSNGQALVFAVQEFNVNERETEDINFNSRSNYNRWIIVNSTLNFNVLNNTSKQYDYKIADVYHYRQIDFNSPKYKVGYNIINPIITFRDFKNNINASAQAYVTKEISFYDNSSSDVFHFKNGNNNTGNIITDRPDHLITNAINLEKDNTKVVALAPWYKDSNNNNNERAINILLDKNNFAYATYNLSNRTFVVSKNDTSIDPTINITLNKYASELTDNELKNLVLQNLKNKITNSNNSNTIVNITNKVILETPSYNPTSATLSLTFLVQNYFENGNFYSNNKTLNTNFNIQYQDVAKINSLKIQVNGSDQTIDSSKKEVEFNSRVSLTAVASINSSYINRLSYQWYKDNQPILNATDKSYTINNFTNNDIAKYKVVVWLSSNNTALSWKQFSININVRQSTAPIISSVNLVSDTNSVNPNADITLTANVTKQNIDDNKIRYQWYKDDVLLSNNNNSNTLVIKNFLSSNVGRYYVKLSHVDYSDITKTSNEINLTLNSNYFNSIFIERPPTSPTLNQAYSLEAKWNDVINIDENKLSFQWQKKQGDTWVNVSSNGNNKVLQFYNWTENDAGNYKVVVTYNDISKSLTSNELHIRTDVDNSPLIYSARLTSNHDSNNITYKDNVTLNAEVDATRAIKKANITYEWYKGNEKIYSGKGESFKSYSINNFTTANNAQYKVVVKYENLADTSSNVLDLALLQTNIPQINNLEIQALGSIDNKVNRGSQIKLLPSYNLVAIEENQLNFTWTKVKDSTTISSLKHHNFTSFSDEDIGYYQLDVVHKLHPEIKSSALIYLGVNNNNNSDDSIVINAINIFADNQVAKYGSTVTITANVIANRSLGSTPNYQWKFKAENSSNEVSLSSSAINSIQNNNNQSILSISQFDKTKAGTYSVEFNLNNRIYKQFINIDFDSFSQPEVKSVLISADKSTVEYNSSTIINSSIYSQSLNQSQLHYQWYKDNQLLENQNESSLYLTNIVTNSTYWLEVWSDINPNHKLRSNPITININQQTKPTVKDVILTTSSTSPISGSIVSLSANVISNLTSQDLAHARYTFKKDGVAITSLDSKQNTYNIGNIDASKNGNYSVEVSFDQAINGTTLNPITSNTIVINIDDSNKININDVSIKALGSSVKLDQSISLEAALSSNNVDNINMQAIQYKWERKEAENWVEIAKGYGNGYKTIQPVFDESYFANLDHVEIRLTVTYPSKPSPIVKSATTTIYKVNATDHAIAFNKKSPFIVESLNSKREFNQLENVDATYLVTQNQRTFISPNLLLDPSIDESLITYEWSKLNANSSATVVSNNKILSFNSFSSSDFGIYELKVTFNNKQLLATIAILKNDVLPSYLEPKVEANLHASSFFVSASAINKENAINYLSLKNIDANEIIIDEVKPNDFLGTAEITYHLKSNDSNSLKAGDSFTVTVSGFFSILNVVIGITAFVVMIILIILLGTYFVKWKAKHQPLRLVYRPVPQLTAPVQKGEINMKRIASATNLPQHSYHTNPNQVIKHNIPPKANATVAKQNKVVSSNVISSKPNQSFKNK